MKLAIEQPLGLLFSAALFLGIAPPLAAQTETVTITNTGNANFRTSDDAENVENVTSNVVTLEAELIPAMLEVIKSSDRAAAEPGDVAVYRVLVRNTGIIPVTDLKVQDRLPEGFVFLPDSLRGAITTGDTSVEIDLPEAERGNRTFSVTVPRLEPEQTLELVYATTLTPDAIRGSGRNAVAASGTGGSRTVTSNTATNQLLVRRGILSDCGTIIGRVFVDRNFDGEQQNGEPGVPNAVIFMDDGNRITTDANGLFSVRGVLSGPRTGTLDLSSMPGYDLAPNLRRIEGNSASRLVQVEPSGLVRMNFAVTPAFAEEEN